MQIEIEYNCCGECQEQLNIWPKEIQIKYESGDGALEEILLPDLTPRPVKY